MEQKLVKDYRKDLHEIEDGFDAFYFMNEGDLKESTHYKQFHELYELATENNKVTNALLWIYGQYDCAYKDEYVNDPAGAFAYLEKIIDEKEKQTGSVVVR